MLNNSNRQQYLDNKTSQIDRPLNDYHNEAKRIINKFAGKARGYLLNSDDAISDVASELMLADWRWDSNNTMSKSSFRVMNGRYAIQRYVKSSTKRVSVPISVHFAEEKNQQQAMENDEHLAVRLGKLPEIEERCIRLYYNEEYTLAKIAGELSLSIEWVRQHIKRGLSRLNKMEAV